MRMLKSVMSFKGETQRSLANKIGISESSLSNKLTGISDFKQTEMQKISTVLSLSPQQYYDIFFNIDWNLLVQY